jgi:hypothetical protein
MRTKVAYVLKIFHHKNLTATTVAPLEVSVGNHAGIFDSSDLKVQEDHFLTAGHSCEV